MSFPMTCNTQRNHIIPPAFFITFVMVFSCLLSTIDAKTFRNTRYLALLYGFCNRTLCLSFYIPFVRSCFPAVVPAFSRPLCAFLFITFLAPISIPIGLTCFSVKFR